MLMCLKQQDCVVTVYTDFWCSTCDKRYKWKSKYERHLESAKHKQEAMLADIINEPQECFEDNDADADFLQPLDPEVIHTLNSMQCQHL
jgi:hypothetical protein